jgi:hypothetical protein
MYDLAGKYFFCFHNDPKVNAEAFLLLHELETYVNGAIIQLSRLKRTRKTMDFKLKELIGKNGPIGRIKKDFNLTRLHCDYHFYFICTGQIYRLLEAIGEVLDDKDIKDLFDKFARKFPIEIRNHLEHLHERAQGKMYKKYIGHISDFGNFVGDGFTFAGKFYSVGEKDLTDLKLIYEELIDIIDTNYASKDPNFIWREQSNRFIARLRSNMKRKGIK